MQRLPATNFACCRDELRQLQLSFWIGMREEYERLLEQV
jgi:hypothetical protein